MFLSWVLLRFADASWVQHRQILPEPVVAQPTRLLVPLRPFLSSIRLIPAQHSDLLSRRLVRSKLRVATTSASINMTFDSSVDSSTIDRPLPNDNKNVLLPKLVWFGACPPLKVEARAQLKKSRSSSNNNNDKTTPSSPSSLAPTSVSAVGRLVSIHRLAKTLATAELVPVPPYSNWTGDGSNEPMSVQLLLSGSEVGGEEVLNPFEGQLVLVRGVTQVDKKESLRHWVQDNQLDVKVSSIRSILTMEDEALWVPRKNSHMSHDRLPSILVSAPPKPTHDGIRFLRLDDLYPQTSITPTACQVTVVDSLALVQEFQHSVARLRQDASLMMPSMIGIDCEWKPHALLETPTEVQPVLVLQVCLHPLRRIFLLDLSALLRPLQSPTEPLDEVETAVAHVLTDLFHDPTILKVGFKMVSDLRRLVASYPHLAGPALGRVEGVIDVARVSYPVLKVLRRNRNTRHVTASLARLVEHCFPPHVLDKSSQCSDWSQTPWTCAQKDYAALDSAIAPAVLETFLSPQHSKKGPPLRLWSNPVQLGRWKDDELFAGSVTSWSFRPRTRQPSKATAAAATTAAAETDAPELPKPLVPRRKHQPSFGNLPPVVTKRWVTGAKSPEN